MSLTYEPASGPLRISVKKLLLNGEVNAGGRREREGRGLAVDRY